MQCEKGLTCLCWLWRWRRKTLSQPRGAGKGKKPRFSARASTEEPLGEAHWQKPPTLARNHRNHLRNVEQISHHQSEELRKGQEGTPRVCHLPESSLLASILAERRVRHQEGPWVRMTGQRQPGNEPHHHKTKAVNQEAELFSWAPLPSCSPPGHPFPKKSLALSAYVSPWTTHFWVLDKRSPFQEQNQPCRHHDYSSVRPTSHFQPLKL